MTSIHLTINGQAVTAEVEPRLHLADFLREQRLLTGTHTGCEHGVCGACTILIDGAPARSCISFAAACDGAEIRTIESFDDDPVMIRLRAAFTRAHALQCGYCTPGMLATSRDVVLRLPDADEARVRLELSGNLCRCTGYAGVVRAILDVLAQRRADPTDFITPPQAPKLALLPEPATAFRSAASPSPGAGQPAKGVGVALKAGPQAVWAILRNPAAVAACLPGARLESEGADGKLLGSVSVAFGPIRARFQGEAEVAYDDAAMSGRVTGGGRDGGGSAASGTLSFRIRPDGSGARLETAIDYRLTGPLAQFGRSALVEDFIQAMLEDFARNIEARLAGSTVAPRSLGFFGLLWRALRRRLFGGPER